MTVDRLELTPSLSTQYHIPSCLRVAIEAHVEETLREAGKPLNVVEIAKSSGIDPSKLGESLSQLLGPVAVASNAIAISAVSRQPPTNLACRQLAFFDSSPFTTSSRKLNRTSSIAIVARRHLTQARASTNCRRKFSCLFSIRWFRETEVLIECFLPHRDPLIAFSSEQGGMPAIIAHFAEEGMRANSYSADSLISPKAEGEFAFSRAYDGDKLWTYFGKEGKEAKQKRFGCAMGKVGKILDRNESVLTNGKCCCGF